MPLDVRVNNVETRVSVVDQEMMLSPEMLAAIVRAVKASLAEDGRIAAERAYDLGDRDDERRR